jgi:two-component system chemotaxis response regulator CheY
MARILVVDDAVFMRRMISDILTKEGHAIAGEAENAREAVRLYKELKPDIMTMDIIMPEVDGIDALGAVREILASDKDARIIMVSAMGQQEMVVESIQAGAKDFIVKPFEPSRVIETVERLLKE